MKEICGQGGSGMPRRCLDFLTSRGNIYALLVSDLEEGRNLTCFLVASNRNLVLAGNLCKVRLSENPGYQKGAEQTIHFRNELQSVACCSKQSCVFGRFIVFKFVAIFLYDSC